MAHSAGESASHPPTPGQAAASIVGRARVTSASAHDLAVMLEPALRAACEDRLGPVEWFHAAWQRGGAATGFSTFRASGDDQDTTPVMVKLPVGPDEFAWTTRVGAVAGGEWQTQEAMTLPTPRVMASGTELGGADLAWVVVERLSGDHLPHHMDEALITELLRTLLAFHRAAERCRPLLTGAGVPQPRQPEWAQLLEKGREVCHEHGVPEHQRWNEAIRKVQKALVTLKTRWEHRPLNTWCHGDVHAGNVLRRRTLSGPGPCVLIDMALVHPGHWIEDALYLERQYWGHEDWIGHAKPVAILSRLRREAGLANPSRDGDYTLLANVRRVLMAACAPAVIDREGGNSKYLHAALGIIERLLPQIPH